MKYDISVYNSLIIEDLTAILTGYQSRDGRDEVLIRELKFIIRDCQKDVEESEEQILADNPDCEKSTDEILAEQTPEDRISLGEFIRGDHAR